MIRKWELLLVGVSCIMGTAMAQNNPILLFPKGAPGETTKLIEKADTDGGKTGGETVLRITNVSEPTITVYPAPDEVATGAAVVVCPGGGYNILAYDLEGDEVCEWLNNLGDERQNLNKDVNGVIIAFGDLGLWNGRKQGYQILGDNIAGILQSTQYDAEWYGDGYDIRGRMSHHDGTNYVLYRVAENRDDAERIAAKIYNYEIDENGFRQVTRSLHPYVAAVYGWKTLQDNLVQVK